MWTEILREYDVACDRELQDVEQQIAVLEAGQMTAGADTPEPEPETEPVPKTAAELIALRAARQAGQGETATR